MSARGMSSGARGWGVFVGVLLVLALLGTAWAVWQRHERAILRAKLEHARLEAGEWERLRAENERLRARQISAAELERLRADHAALPRLRAELETARRALAKEE